VVAFPAFRRPCPVRPDKKGRCRVSKQFVGAVDSLLSFFKGLPSRVDFKTGYCARLPKTVEAIAQRLAQTGDVLDAAELNAQYKRVLEAVFPKPLYPFSPPGEEERRRDLQAAADKLVELLNRVKQTHDTDEEPPAEQPADATEDVTEDGPIEPDAFVWQNKKYGGLPRGPFRALQYLWGRPGRAARPDSDMAEAVYGDHAMVEADFPNTAVRGLRQQLNDFFRAKKLPFHARQHNGYLSIGNGEPKPAKVRRKKPKRPEPRPQGRRKK